MKQIIFSLVSASIMVVIIAVTMVISGRATRQNEVNQALDTAIEQTVDELQAEGEGAYSIDNQQEFLADLSEGILLKIESDSAIEVKVAGCDIEKSLLSVKVVEYFEHINGKTGTTETERTVILESYSKNKKKSCTVTFKVHGIDYKIYRLTEGSRLPIPAAPGDKFICWLDENGQTADVGSLTADTDLVFVAEMN